MKWKVVANRKGRETGLQQKLRCVVYWGSSEGEEQGESCGAGEASATVVVPGEYPRPSSCTGDTGAMRLSLLGAVLNLDYSS